MSMYHNILRGPSITEKNTTLKSTQNKYVFEVDPASSKDEIRRAVEKTFGVNVEAVRTMVVKGKLKRLGRHVGRRPNRKKAIVKLAEGQSIAQFGEG